MIMTVTTINVFIQKGGIFMKKEQKKIAAVTLAFALAVSNLAIQPVDVQAATKKATSIKLNATSKTLYVGQTTTLKVKTVKPAKASKTVTWSTSSKKIATVSSKGKVTAKKEGTAKITAVSKSNKKVKAVCKITVKKKETATPTPSVNPTNTPSTTTPTGNPANTPSASVSTGNSANTQNTSTPIVNSTDMPSTAAPAGNPTDTPSTTKPTAIPTVTAPPIAGDIVHSGAYGNTTWTIDKNGLLEVKGTGDMYSEGEKTGWYTYNQEIKSAKIEVTGATHLDYLFSGYYNLTSLDLSKLDTSNVTNMCGMFWETILTSIDVSSFDTSKVTDMSHMFQSCEKLTSVDVSNFDTTKVTSMYAMFRDCHLLTSIDLSKFDTSNVTNMAGMFYDGRCLTSVDLSTFNTSNVTDMCTMFWNCYSLTSLDLSSFDTSNVTDMRSMLVMYESSNITTIKTPKKSGEEVPDLPEGTWKDSSGNTYTTLPANATESITLTKG